MNFKQTSVAFRDEKFSFLEREILEIEKSRDENSRLYLGLEILDFRESRLKSREKSRP